MTTCRACNRPLTDPASIARGLGRVCDPEPRTRPRVPAARPMRPVDDPAQLGLFATPERDCDACGSLPWGEPCTSCGSGMVERWCAECGWVASGEARPAVDSEG